VRRRLKGHLPSQLFQLVAADDQVAGQAVDVAEASPDGDDAVQPSWGGGEVVPGMRGLPSVAGMLSSYCRTAPLSGRRPAPPGAALDTGRIRRTGLKALVIGAKGPYLEPVSS
jgi:hypothetical protein